MNLDDLCKEFLKQEEIIKLAKDYKITLNEKFEEVKESKYGCTSIDQYLVWLKVQDFLLHHPEVKKLWWTQYTPSFNDGDPCYAYCTFDSTNFILFDTPEDFDNDEEYEDCDENGNNNLQENLEECFKIFDEDYLLKAFGETGSKVVWTKKGLSLEDYYCGY